MANGEHDPPLEKYNKSSYIKSYTQKYLMSRYSQRLWEHMQCFHFCPNHSHTNSILFCTQHHRPADLTGHDQLLFSAQPPWNIQLIPPTSMRCSRCPPFPCIDSKDRVVSGHVKIFLHTYTPFFTTVFFLRRYRGPCDKIYGNYQIPVPNVNGMAWNFSQKWFNPIETCVLLINIWDSSKLTIRLK